MSSDPHASRRGGSGSTARSAAALEDWTTRIFGSCGVGRSDAAQAAAILVRSELRGYGTHGMTRIASYVERLKTNAFNPTPAFQERVFPGGVVMNADGAMGQVAGPHALRLGFRALQSSASVLVAIKQCGHLGALGIYALLAAEAGAFCVLGQRTPPILGMQGFARPAIGHNPIAFGCPVPGGDPIVFDVACSVAARGHILLAAREERPIPEGWALDANGAATTDARRALEGSLLPAGGHKGLGIAMMVEVLAGALSATAASLDAGHNDLPLSGAMGRQGAFLWMVRPEAFASSEFFGAYMRQWTGTYASAAGDRGRLPGTRGARLERVGREAGISLPEAVEQELVALGEALGVAFPA